MEFSPRSRRSSKHIARLFRRVGQPTIPKTINSYKSLHSRLAEHNEDMTHHRSMNLILASAVLASGLVAAKRIPAQPTPQQSLLVLPKRNHTPAIVDPSTLKIIATAPIAVDPHKATASAAAKTATVS